MVLHIALKERYKERYKAIIKHILKNKNIDDIKVGDILTITRYHNNEFEID